MTWTEFKDEVELLLYEKGVPHALEVRYITINNTDVENVNVYIEQSGIGSHYINIKG